MLDMTTVGSLQLHTSFGAQSPVRSASVGFTIPGEHDIINRCHYEQD